MSPDAPHDGPTLQALDYLLTYGECDPAGIIYFASYHPWMERAYLHWSGFADVRSDRLAERHGFRIASRASSVSYRRSPSVYDRMRCEMRLGALGTTSFTLRHDFVEPPSRRLWATGLMTMVTIDPATDEPTPVPAWFAEKLASAGPPVGVEA